MLEIPAGLKGLLRNKTLVTGATFVLTLLGGVIVLREFAVVRYRYRKQRFLSKADAEQLGIELQDPSKLKLEEQYREIKKLDIDNWENKRMPRAWEADTPQ